MCNFHTQKQPLQLFSGFENHIAFAKLNNFHPLFPPLCTLGNNTTQHLERHIYQVKRTKWTACYFADLTDAVLLLHRLAHLVAGEINLKQVFTQAKF